MVIGGMDINAASQEQGPGNLPKMPKWVSMYTEKSVIPAWAPQGGGRVLVNGLGVASRPGCSPSPWIPIKQVLSGVFVCVDLGPGHQGDRDSTAEPQVAGRTTQRIRTPALEANGVKEGSTIQEGSQNRISDSTRAGDQPTTQSQGCDMGNEQAEPMVHLGT